MPDPIEKEIDEVVEGEHIETPEEKLEQLVEDGLNKVFNESEDDSTPEPDAEEPAEEPEAEPEKDADKDDSTPEPEAEVPAEEPEGEIKDDADDGEKPGEQEESPQLPDAYNRAGLHRGMDQDTIDAWMKSDPELCVKTLAQIYEEVNRSSTDFAAIGRKQKEVQAAPAPQPAPTQTPEIPAAPESEFKGIDVDAFEDADPAVIATMKAINEQNRMLTDRVQKLEQAPVASAEEYTRAQARADAQATAALEQQIDTFFSGLGKDYAELYGVIPKDATNWTEHLRRGQIAERMAVVQQMDEMIVGARALGRDLTVDQALERAHLLSTEPIREKIIRNKIKEQVSKRSKSLTLEPSSAAPVKTDGKVAGKALEETVKKEMARIGLK